MQPYPESKKDKLMDNFNVWKSNPTPKTLTPLVKSMDPIIDKALFSYGYSNDPNIKNNARLHVVKSLDRYNPEKGHISTFLHNELKRVQRIGPKHQFAVPMPEHATLDKRNMDKVYKDLEEGTGRPPTDDELADATGMSVKKINRYRRQFKPQITESFASDEGMQTEIDSSKGVNMENLWLDVVYYELDPIDQKILDWTTGRGGSEVLSKTEIAKRLKISNAAVSQRASKIAKKVEEGLDYIGAI